MTGLQDRNPRESRFNYRKPPPEPPTPTPPRHRRPPGGYGAGRNPSKCAVCAPSRPPPPPWRSTCLPPRGRRQTHQQLELQYNVVVHHTRIESRKCRKRTQVVQPANRSGSADSETSYKGERKACSAKCNERQKRVRSDRTSFLPPPTPIARFPFRAFWQRPGFPPCTNAWPPQERGKCCYARPFPGSDNLSSEGSRRKLVRPPSSKRKCRNARSRGYRTGF